MRQRPNEATMRDGKTPRCQKEVCRYIGRWPHFGQCYRSAKVGDMCRQHSPEQTAKRDAEVRDREEAAWRKRRLEFSGARFFRALEQIAAGHNDARGLAQEIVDQFNSK